MTAQEKREKIIAIDAKYAQTLKSLKLSLKLFEAVFGFEAHVWPPPRPRHH